MSLKGEARNEYMRDYMRRRRAAERAGAPKHATTKPAGADDTALVRELAQAKARIAEQAREVAALKAELARKRGAETGLGTDENLKARIAELEADAKRSRFSGQGYIMPEKQFTDLRRCLHPDVIAFMETLAKDNPALQPKVEPLIKQFAKAAITLNEFKDVLVNRAAEEKKKQSDAFRAAWRWKRDEELRKKDQAKREAAAAKRAAKRATAK